MHLSPNFALQPTVRVAAMQPREWVDSFRDCVLARLSCCQCAFHGH